jgi:hypothetical protein
MSRNLISLERRHSIAVDQRDLSPGMVVHPVDATRGDEVSSCKQYTSNELRSERRAHLNS